MHPYHAHRQGKVEHRRVGHITKGYAAGGAVHSDAAEDRKMVKAMVRPGSLKEYGGASKHRADRARGGRTKKHHGKTIVNVITGSHGGPTAPPGLAAGAGPVPPSPMAGPAPPPMMPPRPPMGAGPGGPPMPPPGLPMRAKGGRVGATKGDGTKPAPVSATGASGRTWESSKRLGTHVTHTDGKGDGKDIGRGKVVTYAKGGKVGFGDPAGQKVPKEGESPTGSGVAGRRLVKFWAGGSVGKKAGGAVGPLYSRNAPMGPEFEGGAGGGEARLEKAARAKRKYKAA